MENQNEVWITGTTIHEQTKSRRHEFEDIAPPISSFLIPPTFYTNCILSHCSSSALSPLSPLLPPPPNTFPGISYFCSFFCSFSFSLGFWFDFFFLFIWFAKMFQFILLQNPVAEQETAGQPSSPTCYSCVGRDRGDVAEPLSERRKYENYCYHHHYLWVYLYYLVMTVTTAHRHHYSQYF